MDGLVKGRQAVNTQHQSDLVKDNMQENETIPGGWNRQREARNNQQDSGSVEGPTTKPKSHRYLKLSRLVLSWKGLGMSLLATISGMIVLQLYFNFIFLVPTTP